MFQETQNWWDDGCAEEAGRSLLQAKQCRTSTRWILIVLESILFLAMYLLHTWRGEANLEKQCKTLNEVDENMQDLKQKFYI